MEVHSPVHEEGEHIPPEHTCDGEDVSLPLEFTAVPRSARSLALVYEDPDSSDGTFVHWVLWNLDPDTKEVPRNADPGALGAVVGRNSWGRNKYGGPCPGSGTHRYFVRAYALDRRLDLPAETEAAGLREAMDGHVLAEAEWMGMYRRS